MEQVPFRIDLNEPPFITNDMLESVLDILDNNQIDGIIGIVNSNSIPSRYKLRLGRILFSHSQEPSELADQTVTDINSLFTLLEKENHYRMPKNGALSHAPKVDITIQDFKTAITAFNTIMEDGLLRVRAVQDKIYIPIALSIISNGTRLYEDDPNLGDIIERYNYHLDEYLRLRNIRAILGSNNSTTDSSIEP